MFTQHANARIQQRSIPPLINQWLTQFGEETYDGLGGIVVYFSRSSIRAMEREFGCRPVRQMSQYLNIYKVESSHDGDVITLGHRTKRVWRR